MISADVKANTVIKTARNKRRGGYILQFFIKYLQNNEIQ